MEKKHCEACGHLMGEMSEAAFDAAGRLCEDCAVTLFGDDCMDATAENVQQF